MFAKGFEKVAAILPKTMAGAKKLLTSKPVIGGAAAGAIGGAAVGATSTDEFGRSGGFGGAVKGALTGGLVGGTAGAAAKKLQSISRLKRVKDMKQKSWAASQGIPTL